MLDYLIDNDRRRPSNRICLAARNLTDRIGGE